MAEHMEEPIAGQVVFITGGGRGIGRALAFAFAEAGATVVITARTRAQVDDVVTQISEQGGNCAGYDADVTDKSAMQRIFDGVYRNHSRIDLLINNAGIFGPVGPLWETPLEEWWYTLDVNVRGAVLCMQIALPAMIERKRGRVINISSPAAAGRFPYATAYPASKAALTSLTRGVAHSTAEYGITVFALGPQFIRTSASEFLATSPEVNKWFDGRFKRMFDEGSDTPMERTVTWCLDIAAGKADVLTGRHISDQEDLATLLHRADEILQQDLLILALRK